jgi:hypothetical protein
LEKTYTKGYLNPDKIIIEFPRLLVIPRCKNIIEGSDKKK